jgi:hypothetical protein
MRIELTPDCHEQIDDLLRSLSVTLIQSWHLTVSYGADTLLSFTELTPYCHIKQAFFALKTLDFGLIS